MSIFHGVGKATFVPHSSTTHTVADNRITFRLRRMLARCVFDFHRTFVRIPRESDTVRSMAYPSFQKFVQALEEAGELTRVAVPVETDLVISEWANREMKSPGGGKALLFEKPTIDGRPSQFPVAINTMGSRKRMALALKLGNVEDLAQEIQLILKAKPPTDLREGWSLLKQGLNLLHARPKHAKEGVCQEVVHKFDPNQTSNLKPPCAIFQS